MSDWIFMPRDRPSVYVAIPSDTSMTISGLVQNLRIGCQASGAVGTAIEHAINATGSSALAKQLKVLGSSLSGRMGATNKVIGFDLTLRNSPAYTGPARIIAGMATMRP